jgi:hypothetical protein
MSLQNAFSEKTNEVFSYLQSKNCELVKELEGIIDGKVISLNFCASLCELLVPEIKDKKFFIRPQTFYSDYIAKEISENEIIMSLLNLLRERNGVDICLGINDLTPKVNIPKLILFLSDICPKIENTNKNFKSLIFFLFICLFYKKQLIFLMIMNLRSF